MDSKQGEKDFNFQLIAYVKQNSLLYDPNNPSHKDNALKVSIYKKFADEHRVDSEFVARRWANLRNSYVRIKRERRTKPYKINNSWVYLEVLKFLDPILSTYSSAPSYSLASESKIGSNSSYGLKMDASESMGSDYTDDVKLDADAEDMLFTQSMTYFENNPLNGNENSTDNDLQNSNDFSNHVAYDNGEHQDSLLAGLSSLNDSVKKLNGQQQQLSRHFMKLSQFISEQQNNHLVASQSDQAKTVNPTDKVSIFLDYTLKPLLETVSSDPIKFAKLQTKITQVVIEELESQKSL